MDPRKEIEDLKQRVTQLERLVPPSFVADLARVRQNADDLVISAGPPVSNTPTADGYAPFFVNGRVVNLLTGS